MSNKALPLAGTPRTEFGKGAARRARRAGQVPVVLYGHGMDPVHVTVDRLEFTAIVRHHGVNALVQLDVEGEKHLALVKSVDQNVLTLLIDHADLLAVKRGEKLEVEVPVVHVGEIGPGGVLMQEAEVIKVEADALNVPEQIEVSVEGLEPGAAIHAGDITLPEGATLVDEAEVLVLHVAHAAKADTGEEESEEASEEAAAE